MSQSPPVLRLGTRGSKLALAQSESVRARLMERGARCEIVVIKTSGDKIQDRALADLGGKGLFTKELEQALLVREIDLAVHSMKDMPAIEHDALAIGAVSAREDPRDAFLSHSAMKLAELPKGARVGTSSVRRTAQLARARSDLEIMLLRGNVDTRLAKLDAGQYDAIILAHAGLKRLGLAARATSLFELREWLPALSQGAVGVQLRKDDDHTYKTINVLNDTTTFVATVCERAFQMALDGTCRTPIAGLATYAAGRLAFRGEVLAPDGSDFVETQFDVPLDSRTAAADAHRLGFEAGMALKPRAACWLAL